MDSDQNNLTILLSADDTDEQFIFRTAIEEVEPGAEVLAFRTSHELIYYLQALKDENAIENKKFLLLADLKPPFFSLSDIRHIRELDGFSDLPVHVFAEGFANIEAHEAHSNGATTFSFKPASLKEMRRTFKDLLTTYRTANEQQIKQASEN